MFRSAVILVSWCGGPCLEVRRTLLQGAVILVSWCGRLTLRCGPRLSRSVPIFALKCSHSCVEVRWSGVQVRRVVLRCGGVWSDLRTDLAAIVTRELLAAQRGVDNYSCTMLDRVGERRSLSADFHTGEMHGGENVR